MEELQKLALDENNQTIINENLKKIKNLKNLTKKNEIKCFLSGESDVLDCYL